MAAVGGAGGGATHAADAPLPPGWSKQVSAKTGQVFYYHKESGVSQWTPPAAGAATPSSAGTPKATVAAADAPLPAGWTRETSAKTGRVYYHHRESGKSQWDPPTAATPAPAARAASTPTAAAVDKTECKIYGKDAPPQVKSKRDHLFASLDASVRDNMMVDEVALYSITPSWMAEQMTELLAAYVPATGVITDSCACVGGNTLNFAKRFRHVYAIEFAQQRKELLEHNVRVCGLADKVTCLAGDYHAYRDRLVQDAVFVDPPWGGPDYASKPSLDLSLGGVDMAELVRLLRDRAKVVMLKLPLNFNVKGFTERIGDAAQIAETRKMARVLVIMLRTNPSKRAVKRGRED